MINLNREIFEQISIEKGCDIAFPIKEKMLIEVIKQFIDKFHDENGKLVFGGGTSLVSAYGELTKRFSEDADFRFIPTPKSTKLVRNKLINIASSFEDFALVEAPKSDSHKIEFHFKDAQDFIQKNSSLRPYIKVEVYFSNRLFYPPIEKDLRSFYNKSMNIPAETKINCVALEDTALDKISSLLWRIVSNKNNQKSYNPADIRHLHDIACLKNYITIDEKFKKNFKLVMQDDILNRLKSIKDMSSVLDEAITELQNNYKYKNDFEIYVRNMSYAVNTERLSFEDALIFFVEIVNQIKN